MPSCKSKSQSKSGGRRKKQTKRKLRRGRKSRKVMRGGVGMMDMMAFNKWLEGLSPAVRSDLYIAFNVQEGDELPPALFKKMAGKNASSINTNFAASNITNINIKKLLNEYKGT